MTINRRNATLGGLAGTLSALGGLLPSTGADTESNWLPAPRASSS